MTRGESTVKRHLRSNSTNERNTEKSLEKPSKLRRPIFENSLRTTWAEVQDELLFAELTLMQAKDVLSQAEQIFQSFEHEHLKIITDLAEEDDSVERHQNLYTEIIGMYTRIRRAVCQRFGELTPASEQQNIAETSMMQQSVKVEMQENVNNMRNTWGTFSGDYAKWHSFRDRFKKSIHDEPKVSTILKFQWLMLAVKGEAAAAMGEWKLEEANYMFAWNRLCEVYEDDYLAVQTFVRRLLAILRMEKPTYKGIRRIIDTINECVQQLSNFVDTTNWDPITVFMAIDLMDSTTFEAWESMRENSELDDPSIDVDETQSQAGDASQNAAGNDAAGGASASASDVKTKRYSVNIPSWNQVRWFLEKRARIMVHSERRDRSVGSENQHRERDSSQSSIRTGTKQKPKQQERSQKQFRPKPATGYPPCPLCNCDHPLYHCEDFRGINLNGRWDFVRDKNLCSNCLRSTDHTAAECSLPGCDKCPNKAKHNGLLCSTKEANRRTAHLAMEVDQQGPSKVPQQKRFSRKGSK